MKSEGNFFIRKALEEGVEVFRKKRRIFTQKQ